MTGGKPLRLRRGDLFRSLGYVPHPGQLEVHRSRAPRRVIACGTRWGKSTLAVYEAIAALLEPKEQTLGWIVAPTYELTSRVFGRVVDVLHERLRHRVIVYSHQGHWIQIVNLGGGTSELRAKSADKPTGLLGEALDFMIIDEAASIRDNVYDEHLAARLVDRKGWGLFLSTPGGPDWFYAQYRRGERRHDPDYASFSMPTWSNPHVPAETVAAERGRLPADQFRQQYGAEFLGVENWPCETCGGPSANLVSHAIVLRNNEQPLLCADCGRYVGEDGKSRVWLMPNGEPYTMVVILQDTPPMPGGQPPPFQPDGPPDPDQLPALDPAA